MPETCRCCPTLKGRDAEAVAPHGEVRTFGTMATIHDAGVTSHRSRVVCASACVLTGAKSSAGSRIGVRSAQVARLE